MNSEPSLLFKKFSEEHFTEYQSWFSDDELKTALEGVDEEWLDHIINNEEGLDYAIFERDKMIGVVGLLFPTEKNSFYVLSNIAVHPEWKNKGKGSRILSDLFQQKEISTEDWICFVAIDNISAHCFFEKNNWNKEEAIEDEMYCFRFKR